MGIYRGSLTFSRFFVRGSPPKDFRNKYVQAIRLRRFEPMAPEDEAQEASGWCVIERPFDLDLNHENVYHDRHLLLGFRVDKWRIPGAVLRAHVAEEERRLLEKTGRSKLSRPQKAELKQRVTARLRRKVIPSTQAIDMCWNLDAGTILFFSHSPRLHADFAALFEKTFGLGLVEDSPYIAAQRSGLTDAEQRALTKLDPVSFSSGRMQLESLRQSSPEKRASRESKGAGAEVAAGAEGDPATTDLMERVETTRFLGPELLLWIWIKHELLTDELELAEVGTAEVWLDTELTLQSPLDPGERVTLRGAQPTSGGEGKAALKAQKFPIRSRMAVRLGERDFALVLKAPSFAIASGSIPAVLAESDDAFLERVELIEQLARIVDEVFGRFLRVRLGADWTNGWEPALMAWLEDEPIPPRLLQRLAKETPPPTRSQTRRRRG